MLAHVVKICDKVLLRDGFCSTLDYCMSMFDSVGILLTERYF